MQSFITKILNYQQENGTRQIVWKGLVTLKNALFFYEKEVVGCLSVIDQAFSASLKIPVTIRAAEMSDVPELKILTAGYKKREFLQWINDNYICYIAQLQDPAASNEAASIPNDGNMQGRSLTRELPTGEAQTMGFGKKIVGYICVCPANKSKHKLIAILKLKDTDYWALDAYIHPAFRGKGINSAIASGVLAQAKREGYRRGYGTILLKNKASRRAYGFIGEKEIGLFTTITIVGVTFHFLKRNRGYEEYFN